MIVGYARVSTDDQKMDLQLDDLKKAGCSKIYSEVASGAKTDRKELAAALNMLREGDMLIVWRLDRLGRSMQHLINTVKTLESNGIGFKSLQDNIDTSTASGKFMFHLFSALADFERELIRERSNAGLRAARARGRIGGQPRKLTDVKRQKLYDLYDSNTNEIKDIAKIMGISRTSVYNYLAERKPIKV